MTFPLANPLPNSLHSALTKLSELEAFNMVIGNDGSAEFTKNFETVHQDQLPGAGRFIPELVEWLAANARTHIPNGLRLPENEMDFDLSIFTMRIPGEILGQPKVQSYMCGIYGRSTSPESTQKDGYVIFKPE